MMYNYYWGMMNGSWGGSWGFWLMPMIIWTIFWKAWAMWIAARRGEKIWYGALLVINTMGILEILYIFIFSKMKMGACCGTGSCCKSSDACCADEGCKDEPEMPAKKEVEKK